MKQGIKKRMALALCLALVFTAFSPAAWLSYADLAESEIIWLEYGKVSSFSEGLAQVELDGKRGFIDKTGKEVVPPKYDGANDFSEGLAAVKLDEKWGFIDKAGKIVIQPRYDYAKKFSEGLAPVELDKKWGLIDKTGKEVVPLRYDDLNGVREDLAAIQVGWNGTWGFIDKNGNEVIPPIYSGDSPRDTGIINGFSEGLAAVKYYDEVAQRTVWSFIDHKGNKVFSPNYDRVMDFKDGLAKVIKGDFMFGVSGFIDKTGKEVISPKYECVSHFSEGMAAFCVNLKHGFIDKTGKEVISPKYDDAKDFSEGLAAVKLDGKWGFVDKTGKELVPPKYDDAKDFSEGLSAVKLDGKWGLMKHPIGAPSTNTSDINAKYSKVNLSMDGVAVKGMEVYNIENNNYFKLRDVAKLLEQSEKKFSVDWNGEKKLITLSLGKAYQAAGGELAGGDGKDKTAVLSAAKLELDGKELSLNAYSIGGNNYFKIRDLAEVIGAKVDWDQNTKTILLSTK